MCVTAPTQKAQDKRSICTVVFECVHGNWELDVMRQCGIKPGTEQGEVRSCDGMLSCRVVELCGWPLWSLNSWNVSMSPINTTRVLMFHPTNPRRCFHLLPQPGPIQPSGPAWFLLQAGECHGNASDGMLTHRHAHASRTHTPPAFCFQCSLACSFFCQFFLPQTALMI